MAGCDNGSSGAGTSKSASSGSTESKSTQVNSSEPRSTGGKDVMVGTDGALAGHRLMAATLKKADHFLKAGSNPATPIADLTFSSEMPAILAQRLSSVG